MGSSPKIVCLTDDLDRYNLAFETYEKKAVSHGFKSWIEQGIPEIASKMKKTFSSNEVKLLSVGCGTGRLDSKIVGHFQPLFPAITNHVIEPGQEAIATYRKTVSNPSNQLAGITYEWFNMTFDEFKTNQGSNPCKFHFISTIHSLYYADDPQIAIEYLYGLLEDGGILLLVMQDEKSGIERVVRRFNLFPQAESQVDAFEAIRNHLHKLGIKYKTHDLPAAYDVTCCYQDSEEGSLLLDFISHACNYKQVVSKETQQGLLEYMKSAECSEVKGEQVLLDAKEVALVITK